MPRKTKADGFNFVQALKELKSGVPKIPQDKYYFQKKGGYRLEKDGQKEIIDRLIVLHSQKKLFVHRSNVMGVYDPTTGKHRALQTGVQRGFPDVVVIIEGEFVGIEVKSKTGKLSDAQKDVRDRLLLQGAYYWVLRDRQGLLDAFEKFDFNLDIYE